MKTSLGKLSGLVKAVKKIVTVCPSTNKLAYCEYGTIELCRLNEKYGTMSKNDF